ncbi:hypothetical protein QAD02_002246 [Eretmocerus hayati]|uniref:Uncharacterized protein n=1 Tax=Eretmocerus hayati TaxID=131215 RepID=A0ACC2NIQ8_9HYME|nr:hypothetical protein QAD02_002246 [Eretmocerus hayati]
MDNRVQRPEQGQGVHYKTHETDGSHGYFKCSNKNTSQCKGTARLLRGQNELVAIEPHSPWCEDDGEDELITMRQWMVEQQTNQYWEFKPLWEAACKKFPNAAAMTSLHSIYSSLSRTRLGIFPKVARNFKEFCKQVENHEFHMILNYNGEFEVSAEVIEDDEKNKHVSVCDKQLIKDYFGSTKKALFDGTFYSRINLPECKQLFCVNVVYKAKIIVVYYCFMTSMTGPAYRAVYTHLKSIDPFVELEIGMFDFEQAMRLGFRQVFPNVRITSCNVHYDWAVLAKCSKLPVAARNHPGFSRAVLDLQALAFLPPDKIQGEFDRQCAVMEPQLRAHMSPILDEYFPNYWLKVITPRGFSVYGLDTRTNNGSESNNHTMHTDLGKRPQTCIAMSWRELEKPPVNLSVPEFITAIGRLKGKSGGDVNKGIARIAEEYVDAEFAQLKRTPTDLIDPENDVDFNKNIFKTDEELAMERQIVRERNRRARQLAAAEAAAAQAEADWADGAQAQQDVVPHFYHDEVDAAAAQSAPASQNLPTPILAAAGSSNATGQHGDEQGGGMDSGQEHDSTPDLPTESPNFGVNDQLGNLHGTESGNSDADFTLHLESSSNNSSHYDKTIADDSTILRATEHAPVFTMNNVKNIVPESSGSEDDGGRRLRDHNISFFLKRTILHIAARIGPTNHAPSVTCTYDEHYIPFHRNIIQLIENIGNSWDPSSAKDETLQLFNISLLVLRALFIVRIQKIDQHVKRPTLTSLESRSNIPSGFNSEEDILSPPAMTSTPVRRGETDSSRHDLRQKFVSYDTARHQNFSLALMEQEPESAGVDEDEAETLRKGKQARQFAV